MLIVVLCAKKWKLMTKIEVLLKKYNGVGAGIDTGTGTLFATDKGSLGYIHGPGAWTAACTGAGTGGLPLW